jgi:hypothetical protein
MVSEKPLSNGLQIDHRRDTFVMHLTKSFGYGGILTKRNNEDIEDMYSKGVPKADLLICGNMYVIDYQNYLQYRKDGCGRVRRIKRDNPSVSVKGVAGLIQLQ